MTFSLRKPDIKDALAILQCHQAAIKAKALAYYGEHIVNAWAPKVTDEVIQRIESEINQPDWIYLVAESEEGIIGFGIVVPKDNELRAVYVRPSQSKQVGTTIMAELLAQSRRMGLTHLQMDASANAAPFYAQNGFKVISKGFHTLNTGDQMDCVKMRLDFN